MRPRRRNPVSVITDKIKAYKAGTIPWRDLFKFLTERKYVTPQRYDDPQPTIFEERDWDHPYVDGSWDEVQRARSQGLLTDAEFYDVLHKIAQRPDGKDPRKDPYGFKNATA